MAKNKPAFEPAPGFPKGWRISRSTKPGKRVNVAYHAPDHTRYRSKKDALAALEDPSTATKRKYKPAPWVLADVDEEPVAKKRAPVPSKRSVSIPKKKTIPPSMCLSTTAKKKYVDSSSSESSSSTESDATPSPVKKREVRLKLLRFLQFQGDKCSTNQMNSLRW